MKKHLLLSGTILLLSPLLYSFCGFYVSKADGTIKNNTSQVILVRDGNRNVITMYNDFQGATKDFAMVVPVPVVLKKKDIRVIDPSLFQRLNDYSAPRLVEYYDENPCNDYSLMDREMKSAPAPNRMASGISSTAKKNLGVVVEASYQVGEYDILILSANESSGLREWLTMNGYKIPAGAETVLVPYIKSNLKFFVVKVNEKEKKKLPGNFLRPLQISFNSPRFMLPIRLGMANATGDQDMIVYAFTRKGRIECTNYRNVEIATGNKVPLFVKKNFGAFYSHLFKHQWEKENKRIGFVEYAWDVSPANFQKCDPCVGNPPDQKDLLEAGVWWLQRDWEDYTSVDNIDNYKISNNVFFTRLHFRYNRENFPQDLMFQLTPNTTNFQARYIITHLATGDLSCTTGNNYLSTLYKRRKQELKELYKLTGRNLNNWQDETLVSSQPTGDEMTPYMELTNLSKKEIPGAGQPFIGMMVFGVTVLGSVGFLRYKGFV